MFQYKNFDGENDKFENLNKFKEGVWIFFLIE